MLFVADIIGVLLLCLKLKMVAKYSRVGQSSQFIAEQAHSWLPEKQEKEFRGNFRKRKRRYLKEARERKKWPQSAYSDANGKDNNSNSYSFSNSNSNFKVTIQMRQTSKQTHTLARRNVCPSVAERNRLLLSLVWLLVVSIVGFAPEELKGRLSLHLTRSARLNLWPLQVAASGASSSFHPSSGFAKPVEQSGRKQQVINVKVGKFLSRSMRAVCASFGTGLGSVFASPRVLAQTLVEALKELWELSGALKLGGAGREAALRVPEAIMMARWLLHEEAGAPDETKQKPTRPSRRSGLFSVILRDLT